MSSNDNRISPEQYNCPIQRLTEKKHSGVVWSFNPSTNQTKGVQGLQSSSNMNANQNKPKLESTFASLLHNDKSEVSNKTEGLNGTLPKKISHNRQGVKEESFEFNIKSLGGAKVTTHKENGICTIKLSFEDKSKIPENLIAFTRLVERQLEIKFDATFKVEVEIL